MGRNSLFHHIFLQVVGGFAMQSQPASPGCSLGFLAKHHPRENCSVLPAAPSPSSHGDSPRTASGGCAGFCSAAWLFKDPNTSGSLSVMLLPVDPAFSQKKEGVVLPFRIPECPSSPAVGTGLLCEMLREFLLREHQ